ncbi:meiosis protein SPO22/ZIP4 like-domain-containing protein [Tricladium varicosporioides]|nr:meiosis protein SPO22/ZIP4 like-domain-containing protein [Hymenoscyphus varicosporioides]
MQLPIAAASESPVSLTQEIEKCISAFPGSLGSAAALRCEEIDTIGTALWNLCTRLRRDKNPVEPGNTPSILVVARVFAFLLLNCAHDHGKVTVGNSLRLMRIGIKAAKGCLEEKQVDPAQKVLEKFGKQEEALKKAQVELTPEDVEECERLNAEYFVLRTALAWYKKQFDIVEYLYNNSKISKQTLDQNTAEHLADVLYEMGKELLLSHQYSLAAKWLDRAHNTLVERGIDNLSMDASELRISIIQSYVTAQLRAKEEGDLEKAQNLIDTLYNEFGDKLVVLLLKLDLLTARGNFDHSAYFEIIHQIIRTVILSDDNFKLILFHIRKLNELRPDMACQALDGLFKRTIQEGKQHFIERVIITRLWMTTSQETDQESIVALEKLLSTAVENFGDFVSLSAMLAAHTLLWKRIESSYVQCRYETAEKWCRLALHPIFKKSGDLNLARISRKLLLCALARSDFGSAKDTYGRMPDSTRNEPTTRFLMYKVAVRSQSSELASECLQSISNHLSSDPTLLYACCLDAMSNEDKVLTLAGLQHVLDKYNYNPPQPVYLPSLLRITIKLTHALLEESHVQQHLEQNLILVEKLCKLYEGAASMLQKSRATAQNHETSWVVLELDWFSKTSYNTAIKYISSWPPYNSLRMLTCCIIFIDHYPLDISAQISDDLSLRKMFCEFSAGTALVALARGEDNIEKQLQYYLTLRKHVCSFDRILQEKLEKMEDDAAQDLLQKLSVLLAFDFEAGCKLKAWDGLGETILRADICKSMHLYELMANCILSCQPPTSVLITTLKKIVNEAWSLEEMDSIKLAKYMRCLFHVAISDNADVAERLLDQIYGHAKEASETEQPYPTEELDWIASKAFNHAIDLYCNGDDEGCKNWAAKAFNVAHYCSDEGALERLLQNKFMALKFDA